MVLSWLKHRRRRALPAAPFPPRWLSYLKGNFGHYAYLSGEERSNRDGSAVTYVQLVQR